MQEVTRKELEKLIAEAKAAGKDTSKLEKALEDMKTMIAPAKPPEGEVKEKKKKGKKWVIISTGPAREEDFEE